MTKTFLIFLCILPELLFGQYTYFNEGYPPPFPEIGSGGSTNLLLRNDTIFTYGFAPFQKENGRQIYLLDYSGNLEGEWLYPEGNDVFLTDHSDNILPFGNGFAWAGARQGHPLMIVMNFDFSEHFRIEYPSLNTDTTYSTYFTINSPDANNLLSVGRNVYDLEPEVPGQDFANLILSKHDADGNEIWFHEYTLEDLNVTDDNLYSIFPRGGITPLPNGDFLVWCTISEPSDCYAFKFDSLGYYIDHVSWGHPTYSDGSAWPVQISENEFMFAYSHPVSYVFDYLTTKPRVGVLNTDDMSVDLFPVLDFPQEFGGITDFEKTSDGDFVILGYGGPDIQGEIIYAYMLRINELGEVVWFKTYTPPEFSYELNAYDLEITSDGGFAFVGNYRPLDDQIFYYKTWVVKTDACGDLQDNGCPVSVEENNVQGFTFQMAPNPSRGIVQISSNQVFKNISIFDIAGKLVFTSPENYAAFQTNMDVSKISRGLYLVEVRFEDGVAGIQRLIIE